MARPCLGRIVPVVVAAPENDTLPRLPVVELEDAADGTNADAVDDGLRRLGLRLDRRSTRRGSDRPAGTDNEQCDRARKPDPCAHSRLRTSVPHS
jgi:hypothetical protein